MPQPLAGPQIGLPLPQNLYPSELNNAPYDSSSNRVALAPGQSLVLPAGDWYINLGQYLVLQFLDPVTSVWSMGSSGSWNSGLHFIKSDGFTCRVANLTGCPVSGSVSAYGSGYVQATTTITVTGGGGSTWLPIVGGQLAFIGGTAASPGAGYGVAPIILVSPPPPAANNSNGVGGVAAAAWAVITSGTISAVSFVNPGAGYPTAATAVVVPSPFDPNLSTGITAGTVTFSLTGSGSITGALCTNSGAPLSNPANITLTVSGAGTNATVVPNMLQTITTVSLTGTGLGWGTTTGLITSAGGSANAGTIVTGPEYLYLAFRPRPAQVTYAITNAGTVAAQVGTILDGGLFLTKPTPIQLPGQQAGQSGSIVGSTIAFTMGSTTDIAVIQPAP